MGQIQREMVPELEQSLHTDFLKCDLWLPDKDGGKRKEKPAGASWDTELHHCTPAAPTPKFSNLIGLTEISFQLCLIKRSKTV